MFSFANITGFWRNLFATFEVFCVKCVRLICLGAGSRGAKCPFKHAEATVTSACCLRDMHGHHGEDTDPFHVCLFSSYPATGLTGV